MIDKSEFARKLREVAVAMHEDRFIPSRDYTIFEGVAYDPIGKALEGNYGMVTDKNMFRTVGKYVHDGEKLIGTTGDPVDDVMMDLLFAVTWEGEWNVRKIDIIRHTKRLAEVVENAR